jgi:Anti-sigma-28 factor, FlgM
MTTDGESSVMTLKERLDQGEYKIDSQKVADAILSNPLWIVLFAGTQRASGKAWPNSC